MMDALDITAPPAGRPLDVLGKQKASVTEWSEHSRRTVRYGALFNEARSLGPCWYRLGLRPGDRVIVAQKASVAFLHTVLSLLDAGIVPVLASNRLPTAALEVVASLVIPQAIVHDPGNNLTMPSGMVPARECPVQGAMMVVSQTFHPEARHLAGHLILTSSGTTGHPKAVLHRVASILQNARMHAAAIGQSSHDSYLLSVPGYYSYGFVAGLLAALVSDTRIILPDETFFPAQWLDTVAKGNVTITALTPFILKSLIGVETQFPECLRTICIGGDRTPPDAIEHLRALYHGDIYLTYGLSEAGPRVFTNKVSDNRDRWSALGEPLPGVEISILSETQPGSSCDNGELLIRTPTAMCGYFDRGSIGRADIDSDGWLHTHDIVARDPKTGCLHFVDRRKNMIVSGGEKLYGSLIREILITHPSIEDAVIVARPHRALGECPHAIVKLANGCPDDGTKRDFEQDLIRWCRQRLRLIEVPRSLEFRDILPRRDK